MGKLLWVDLTKKSIEEKILPEDKLRKFIGGSGIAASILYEETGENVDPLGPENVLIFMTGPMTGCGVYSAGRHEIVGKSPLTNCYGESDVGGKWGLNLKKAGVDGIVIKGMSETPVYLVVTDEKTELCDADAIWGWDTFETADYFSKIDPKLKVSCIGPAGEKMVRYASVMHDGLHARAGGRCGFGAVMGSKKLKAIVTKGTQKPEVMEKEKLKNSLKSYMPTIKKKTATQKKTGTCGNVITAYSFGDLPIKNWQESDWQEGAEKLSDIGKYKIKNSTCGECPAPCGLVVTTEGVHKVENVAAPEYESAGAFGSLCLVDDLAAVCKATNMCDRYGIDTISTGAVIATTIELVEKNMFPYSIDDIEIEWGNVNTVLGLIELIGEQKGIGNFLGMGVKRMIEEIGNEASDLAIHIKGLEFPMHDPRAFPSLAIAYATSNRGACHLQSYSHTVERAPELLWPELDYKHKSDRLSDDGKSELAAKMQDVMSLVDSFKMCKRLLRASGASITDLANWLNYITGWDMDTKELLKAGERIYNLKRMYNVNKCNISRKDDTFPHRILTLPHTSGASEGNLNNFGRLLTEYYDFRGWSKEGIPTKEKLEELDLKNI